MINGLRVLAIVTARGGSKRVENKNIRLLGGSPLISWSVRAGLQSQYVDTVAVTSDSDAILDAARHAGAEEIIKRPAELATDTARTQDVILHTLHYFEERGQQFDLFVLLLPTCPLRDAGEIDRACEFYCNKGGIGVVGVVPVDHAPDMMINTLPDDQSLKQFRPDHNYSRHDHPQYYRVNGAIYIFSTDYYRQKQSWFDAESYAYVMSREHSVDIDHEIDLLLADALLSQNRKEL
jgi:CMP-N,N'-diacetyllegionaminic acid synthase